MPWFGSGRGPGTVDPRGDGVLHAEQHYEYHRPLLVWDVLTADVREDDRWERRGGSGGRLLFWTETTDFRDADGERVVTARAVWVRPEQAAEQA